MNKRRHHYVWQHYLKAWTSDGHLYCLHDRTKIIKTNTSNVANERDFYRLRELTDDALKAVRAYLAGLEPKLRELNEGWLEPVLTLFEIKRIYDAYGRKTPEADREFEAVLINLEEDMHASIESGAIPILAALRNRDASFIQDKDAWLVFCRFINMQYLRTPRIAHNVSVAFARSGIDPSSAMGVMRMMLSTSSGYALFTRRDCMRFAFLETHSGRHFISGDQPAINVRSVEGEEPREFELYYPVSPQAGILVHYDAPHPGVVFEELTASDVERYNSLVAKHSLRQLYASSESELLPFKK